MDAHSRIAHIPRFVRPSCRGSGVRVASVPGLLFSFSLQDSRYALKTHGPMMILAPGTGRLSTFSPSLWGPMHVTGVLTSLSQPSSCEFSCDLEEVYHEPAWEGSRMMCLADMIMWERIRPSSANVRRNQGRSNTEEGRQQVYGGAELAGWSPRFLMNYATMA